MKVTTNRPILHGGSVSMNIETTDLHARELKARGLIGILPKAADRLLDVPAAAVVADVKPRGRAK